MVKEILNETDGFENYYLFYKSYIYLIVYFAQLFKCMHLQIIYFCLIVITIAPTIPTNNIIEHIINHIE